MNSKLRFHLWSKSFITGRILLLIGFFCLSPLTYCETPTWDGLKLPSGAPLPPELVEELGARTLGQILVHRLHILHEINSTIPIEPDNYWWDDTVIQIDFKSNSKRLQDWSETNNQINFLNGHQSGSAGYSRAQIENLMIGLELEPKYLHGIDNPMNGLRPIYGFIRKREMEANAGLGLAMPMNLVYGYGRLTAVLKNTVKYRSTWAIGDSIDAIGPRILNRSPRNLKATSGAFAEYDKNRGDYIGTFYSNREPNRSPIGYLEAQIWGGIDLRDIAYFLVPDDYRADIRKHPVQLNYMAILKKIGLPIYTYDTRLRLPEYRQPIRLVYRGRKDSIATWEKKNRESMSRFIRVDLEKTDCKPTLQKLESVTVTY